MGGELSLDQLQKDAKTAYDNQAKTTTTGYMQVIPNTFKPASTCPNCGYCPHCGRGGHYGYPYSGPWYGSNKIYCNTGDVQGQTVTSTYSPNGR